LRMGENGKLVQEQAPDVTMEPAEPEEPEEPVIPYANEPPEFPEMSPADVQELTEEMQDKQNALKEQAMEALEDNKAELALTYYTNAIKIGCASALMYSRRAQILQTLDRPRAAANDCTLALAMNPDSGKAYKIRARSHLQLEMWEKAHDDFQTGLRIDYDDATNEEAKVLIPKIKEIQAAAVAKRKQQEFFGTGKDLLQKEKAYKEGLAKAADEAAKRKEAADKQLSEEEAKKQREREKEERIKQQDAEWRKSMEEELSGFEAAKSDSRPQWMRDEEKNDSRPQWMRDEEKQAKAAAAQDVAEECD